MRMECIALWSISLYARAQSLRGEKGQALVEYALVLGLVTVGAVAVLKLIGASVNNLIAPVPQDL